ncbi:nitroreductase family protein [Sediminivirga luteola]|uniref:Nitroreductase n=1 Tax=Sediminivirga luteola TaxID=1774748 RepID=A0A8J2XJF6_9MICO|nr:nitroreductase [Sediminivirga luteola]
MTEAAVTSRTAPADHPILDVLAGRWSPRAFDETAPVDPAKLDAALEAARWSPSAFNAQPWRFIVGQRGTETFEKIFGTLVQFNQDWAKRVGALILTAAEVGDDPRTPNLIAYYDLGQSVAHLSVQAHADGLYVHQMTGFDANAASEAFELPAGFVPVSVVALGEAGSPEVLDGALRERESAPRERKPQSEIVLRRE